MNEEMVEHFLKRLMEKPEILDELLRRIEDEKPVEWVELEEDEPS